MKTSKFISKNFEGHEESKILQVLAIGDFHGKFPDKLKKLAKNVDFILSQGDFAGIRDFRPLMHKVFKIREKGKDITISELIGEKRYFDLLKKDYKAGKKVISDLNKTKKLIYSVFGNNDWYKADFNDLGLYYEKIMKKLKYFRNINRKLSYFKGIKIAGFGGYIDNDVYFTRKGAYSINDSKMDTKKRRKRYLQEKTRFMKLMKSKPDILLLHYNPYGCLDKMKTKGYNLSGSHMGIGFFNKGIKKYQPALVICGHMHENQGQCKIGKSIIVNTGAALEGKAAIIELDKEKIKSVRFVK